MVSTNYREFFMKKLNRIGFVSVVSLLTFSLPLRSYSHERGEGMMQLQINQMSRDKSSVAPEIVKWVGLVRDNTSSHTTNHEHRLQFVKNGGSDVFEIIDSPELVKLHHETEKNYVVEIEAEKIPSFLFWGGNLVVKNFKVVSEASEQISHGAPVKKNNSSRFIGGHQGI
jgi:hypothetical protein